VSDSKRIFDVVVAGTALLLGAPVLALASLAIKLESKGPIFFTQTRVGRNRQPIQTLKLRTMIANADGPQITAGTDRRITRLGRVLRKSKLDELPQLWNVLRGEMSLVGPRPEVPRYAERYRPEWERLFTVRPGLTDLASLTFRDEERLLSTAHDREQAYTEVIMPLKLDLALKGLEQRSLAGDISVMLRTAAALMSGWNVRDNPVVIEALRRIDELNRQTGDS
jgi:lipopolysaccharide/colanic/teichoic acid biosynthesis glycosyltransferase